MRFDQVTLPGSNSAGSGFDGIPQECGGDPGNDCIFRTQGLNITAQLDLGIRYLSLDICFLPENCNEDRYDNLDSSRLVACRGSETDVVSFNGFEYSGSLTEILRQVDEWMRNNTDEVIGIHFTRNIPEADRPRVFDAAIPLMEAKWGQGAASNSSATEMNTYHHDNSLWPTLREAVTENQRIFVFVDPELNPGDISRPWKNPAPMVNFELSDFDRLCSDLVSQASFCNGTGERELIILTGHTLAVCMDEGQIMCGRFLQTASNDCYDFREEENRTVNVVLVNYPESGIGANSVISVVDELNNRNINRFRVVMEIVTSESPTTTDDPLPMTGSGDDLMTEFSTLTTSSATSTWSDSSTVPSYLVILALSALISSLHGSC